MRLPKFFVLLLTTLLATTLWAADGTPELVTGLVDLQKVVTNITEGQEAMKRADAEGKRLSEALDKRQKEIKQKLDAAEDRQEKEWGLMDPKGKKALTDEIMKLRNEAGMEHQKAQMDYQKLEEELRRPIMDKVQEVIKEISKQEGVFQTFVLGMGSPVYSLHEKDITEKVIAAYNKKHPVAKK